MDQPFRMETTDGAPRRASWRACWALDGDAVVPRGARGGPRPGAVRTGRGLPVGSTGTRRVALPPVLGLAGAARETVDLPVPGREAPRSRGFTLWLDSGPGGWWLPGAGASEGEKPRSGARTCVRLALSGVRRGQPAIQRRLALPRDPGAPGRPSEERCRASRPRICSDWARVTLALIPSNGLPCWTLVEGPTFCCPSCGGRGRSRARGLEGAARAGAGPAADLRRRPRPSAGRRSEPPLLSRPPATSSPRQRPGRGPAAGSLPARHPSSRSRGDGPRVPAPRLRSGGPAGRPGPGTSAASGQRSRPSSSATRGGPRARPARRSQEARM